MHQMLFIISCWKGSVLCMIIPYEFACLLPDFITLFEFRSFSVTVCLEVKKYCNHF